MSDYWYDNRDRLQPGHVALLEDGSVVKLKRRVPGDGTDWYVEDWIQKMSGWYWTDNNRKIHPGDIKRGIDFS